MIEYTVQVWDNGEKYWYLNDELHREDGPATEYANGDKFWWLNGKRHREDGPAIEWHNGDKEWFFNGELHREDGPAIEWTTGYKSWYLNGKELTESEFNAHQNPSYNDKVVEIYGKKYKLQEIKMKLNEFHKKYC